MDGSPFCDYVFTDAPANLCANANSIMCVSLCTDGRTDPAHAANHPVTTLC